MAADTMAGDPGLAEFGILGPVQVSLSGRAVPLGGPRQRAVLALLVLEADRVVSLDRLAEGVWAGRTPAAWATTLQTYVFHLRRALEPGRVPGGAGGVLVTSGRGYLLRLGREHLDAARFEDGFAAGRAALEAGRPAEAAEMLRRALGLWRGQVLADLSDYAFTRPEAVRLEELRLAALEARIDADLAVGRHDALTGELERLTADHPLRERLHGQLMAALYRCGRQAEALAAYRRVRDLLADELGIDPGEPLRRLHAAVLAQDPALDHIPGRHALAPSEDDRAAATPNNLPLPLTSFLGREQDVAEVQELLTRARLVTLTGAGGAGKTRLAVEAARIAADRFADGAWLTSLAGIAAPALVPFRVMEALGVRQDSDVAAVSALQFRLRDAELLLVLDNCEHVRSAVASLAGLLLTGAPSLRVLATSREPLGVPGEVIYVVAPLGLPEAADEDSLALAPAVQLFLERGSAARANARAARPPLAVAARICRDLDGLPLAIELAAARMRSLSAGEIEAHLADKFRFLRYSQPVADSRHQTLEAAIEWSHDLLAEDERRVFRELSVFAGGFTLPAAAAVCCGGDTADALDVIDRLVSKSLAEAESAHDETRYRLLAIIREYAADRLAESGTADQTRMRHATTYLNLAERERDLPVLAREHDNFRAALDWSLSAGLQIGPHLAAALGSFWLARGFLQEGRRWLERALPVSASDAGLRADLLRLHGSVLFETSELGRARESLSEGRALAEAAGLRALQARIECRLAEIMVLAGGSTRDALRKCREAAELLESEGDSAGAAEAWMTAGSMCYYLGESPADVEAFDRALAHALSSSDSHMQLGIRKWLPVTLRTLRVPVADAIRQVQQLIVQASGEQLAEAVMLQQLACLYAYAGRFGAARDARARGRAVIIRLGAKWTLALLSIHSGMIELTAGDAIAAERELARGREALDAMGDRRYGSMITSLLAEALYAQGCLDEAWQMTEETADAAPADDVEPQARYRAVRAKILAHRGQHQAATRLGDEAVALIRPTSRAALLAEMLIGQAEIARLAGAPARSALILQQALQIYQQRGAAPLADRVRSMLAGLDQPGRP
jgi:predicted ATPase/DNA-binding SARP family transcriptional activator